MSGIEGQNRKRLIAIPKADETYLRVDCAFRFGTHYRTVSRAPADKFDSSIRAERSAARGNVFHFSAAESDMRHHDRVLECGSTSSSGPCNRLAGKIDVKHASAKSMCGEDLFRLEIAPRRVM
jgi:hypothetical protein